jgi:hypothetical protein
MTLILGGGNSEYAFLVADRRITPCVQDDDEEVNKTIALYCGDARAAITFTGLARHHAFRADLWILSTLRDAGPPDYTLTGILDRLANAATRQFASWWNQPFGGLAIMAAGFQHIGRHQSAPFLYTVSNYAQRRVAGFSGLTRSVIRDHFTVEAGDTGTGCYMTTAGHTLALSERALSEVADYIRSRKPSRSVVAKVAAEIQACSRSKNGAGVIGPQCSSVVVPQDPMMPFEGQYHTSRPTETYFVPARVVVRPDEDLAVSQIAIRTRGRVAALPRVGRNAPCPCGSGKKFKKCHGRFR